MIGALALAIVVAADTGDSWIGRDKAKHVLVSAMVHSVAFSATRIVADRQPAQAVGAAAVVSVGLLKEIADRKAGRQFSVRDLLWGIAGGAASAALLNGSR